MDSETNLSTVATSVGSSSNQIRSESSKSKKTRSAESTWVHARQAHENEDPTLKYCKYCTVNPYATTVTTNFRRHLQSKHDTVVTCEPNVVQTATHQQLRDLYSRVEGSGNTNEIDTLAFKKHLNQEVIDEALVSLIVVGNLSFRFSKLPQFHTFCQTLNPESKDYITTSHSQIPKKIDRCFQTHKDLLRKKLQSAISSIHLSLDVWTSPNRLLLLGMCAHFTDRDQETRSKAMLALRPIANHSGETQRDALLPVLEDYGIIQKLGSIVSDNATTNDTLCRKVEERLLEDGVQWNSAHYRLRCTGHIINLAVQAFLFQDLMETDAQESHDRQEEQGVDLSREETRQSYRILGPLGKLHNIVVHIRGSSGRAQEFKRLAERMIPLDNRTRWNSWYDMLEVALAKENHVDAYTKNHIATLRDDYLTPGDWEQLHSIATFLKPSNGPLWTPRETVHRSIVFFSLWTFSSRSLNPLSNDMRLIQS